MGKAKTASKNNPNTRGSVNKFFHNGKEIKPVTVISARSSIRAAEYEGSGDLVLGSDGKPLPWSRAKDQTVSS